MKTLVLVIILWKDFIGMKVIITNFHQMKLAKIENATTELWQMCLQAVDYIIEKIFGIDSIFRNRLEIILLQAGKKIILPFTGDLILVLMVKI
ncbi:hypothetical protein [Chryseobacterium indoltheticum]|uniref:hypothetical protein n=1 Tax=Chryseobacterium indoltheticum TaxID=254 RepID=UPI003F4930AE